MITQLHSFSGPEFDIYTCTWHFYLGIGLQVAKQGRLQKFEIPAKIKLLHEPWTPETGLVTAALKIKRENIRKAFAEDLKSLYLWGGEFNLAWK